MNVFMWSITPAVCAGISACLFLLIALKMFQQITIEKEMSNEVRRSLPVLFKLALPFIGNVRFIARNSSFKAAREHTERQLLMAGYADTVNAVDFISMRIMLGILGAIILVICLVQERMIIGLIMQVILVIYPPVWLRKVIQSRHAEILSALPNVLDLLTLSVQAGKDFLASLRDIIKRRKMDALNEELSRTFHEIKLGKKRSQALRDLATRVGQPDLSTVLNSIIQAEELGVSIGELLTIQGDMLRDKRFARAEKLAGEAPVKIVLPLALFIFPAVVIILVVPIILQAFKTLIF
ncbi:MAG: type II secretion system F family protein [Victivallaceae bacterium]|nr:type II secretion system F family protein [Victivallaceae bacterium]